MRVSRQIGENEKTKKKECKEEGRGAALLHAANRTVWLVGGIIFVLLSWYAFRYTQYMMPGGRELPTNVRDSMTNNLLVAFLILALFLCLSVLEQKLPKRALAVAVNVSLVTAMVWVGLAGMWWIRAVERIPEGDQAFIYGGASYFLEGNYMFLAPGGYCDTYPHQLALIALMELLFAFVGPLNYFAFQVICVMLAVGIVFLGYRMVRRMTKHEAAAFLYCILMMGCLPLIFYTGWVYGDIPSIFFALLSADFLLEYLEKKKWGYLAGMAGAVTMALLVRKNSLILLVALFLVGGVYTVWKKDWRVLAAAGVSALLPFLIYAGINKMYEVRSGYEHSSGLPVSSWIAMGLLEHDGAYGWYWDYAKPIYYANDGDASAANEIYLQDIRDRLDFFRQNPDYTWVFFREKVLSQWNEPLYQSLYFSNKFGGDGVTMEPGTLVFKISNEYFVKVLGFCDRLQFLIYLGMACYFLFAVKKDSNILHHLLAVAVIGGFFFSILWEAKARYIFPYYVTMFPCAVIGYEHLLQTAAAIIRKAAGGSRKEEREKIDRAA